MKNAVEFIIVKIVVVFFCTIDRANRDRHLLTSLTDNPLDGILLPTNVKHTKEAFIIKVNLFFSKIVALSRHSF